MVVENKGVSGERGAQKEGDTLVSHVAQDAADDGYQGYDRGRLEDLLFFGQRPRSEA